MVDYNLSHYVPNIIEPKKPANIKDLTFDIANYIAEPAVVLSQKIDGERAVVVSNGEKPLIFNKKGEPKIRHVDFLRETHANLEPGWGFDGEIVDNVFYVFDIIAAPNIEIAKNSLTHRYALLEKLVERSPRKMVLVKHYFEMSDKLNAFQDIREAGQEGVVLKESFSPYAASFHTSWLKYQFRSRIDCFVTAVNHDKNTAEIALFRDNGLENIGEVSNRVDAKVHDVVEVECLYATEEGKLYQPIVKRVREDKSKLECVYSQLVQAQKGMFKIV